MEFLKTQLAGKQKELAEYESRLRLSSHESDIAIADLRIFVISLLFSTPPSSLLTFSCFII